MASALDRLYADLWRAREHVYGHELEAAIADAKAEIAKRRVVDHIRDGGEPETAPALAQVERNKKLAAAARKKAATDRKKVHELERAYGDAVSHKPTHGSG